MTKRQPHVIDAALEHVPLRFWERRARAVVERGASLAGRFILTDDASYKLGKITRETTDLMLKNHQFAIPPVEPCYLEINLRLMHEAIGYPTSSAIPGFRPEDTDERVGYLLTKERIYSFSQNKQGRAAPAPFTLRKVEPSYIHPMLPIAFSPNGYGFEGMSPEELSKLLPEIVQETQDWNRLAYLLGSGLHHMPDEETRQAFLTGWAIEQFYHDLKATPKLLMSGAGELRTILATLLVLNQPKVIHYTSVGRAVGLSRGKRTVYHAHSVIDVELGKRKEYRRLFVGGTHATPRRHRVRGHFAHYGMIDGCIHEWPLFPDRYTPPTWECRKCHGLRVWRKAHERGDATIGFVTNEYNVEGEAA